VGLLTSNERALFTLALAGGYSQFTKYFFDWEPLKTQWVEHYAPQVDITLLGGIGSGKCVHPATLVWTPSGARIPVSNVKAGQEILCIDEKSLQFVWGTVSGIFDNGVQPLLRIRTGIGHEIKCTPNHPVLTVSGWVRADSLEIGRRIATARRYPTREQSATLTEAHMLILGFLIGDGGLTQDSARFTNTNPELVYLLEEALEVIGPYYLNRSGGNSNRSPTYTIRDRQQCGSNGNGVVRWLRELGLFKCGSHDKFVPDIVFDQPNQIIAAFLRALYACDGWAYAKGKRQAQIGYGTVSLRLATDIRDLLLRFGIVARIRKKSSRCTGRVFSSYEVTIDSKRDQIVFCDQIGIYGKQRQLDAVYAVASKVGRYGIRQGGSNDVIPRDEIHEYVLGRARERGTPLCGKGDGHVELFGKYRLRGNPCRDKVQMLSEWLEDGRLHALANSDVYWDKIVSIEMLPAQPTLNLEVVPYHNFVADGIVTHNTAGKGRSFLTKILTIPWYRGLNTSISSFQATLMFYDLLPIVESNPRVSRFIKDIRTKPYPKITTIWNSYLSFMTVGYQAQGIRGSEWDEINFDEGGYERAEETLIALRGRLRGKRENGVERLARLSVTTSPTDVPWLRRRWERGVKGSRMEVYDPQQYASLRSTLFDNHHIPAWQRDAIIRDLPEEMVQQEIMAEFPDWGDSEFPEKHINACETTALNAYMEHLINPIVVQENGEETTGTLCKEAVYIELPHVGCTLWELPPQPGHIYVLASDPGTSSPPKRNTAVVLVFDVTAKPYRLVYFHWVSGNGSYTPWLRSFRYALDKYQCVLRGLDATGPQKALDELVLERDGIHVDSVNFSRDKMGMLNALKMLLQNHDLEFPFIKGLRAQLRSYKSDDKDLAQDIVAALMVFAYIHKHVPGAHPPTTVVTAATMSRRGQRGTLRQLRRSRR
jgi:intein/homing endonuclease